MPDLHRRDLLMLSGVGSLSALSMARTDMAGGRAHSPLGGAARRTELYRLLGDLPDRQRPISGEKAGEEEHDGFVLERWRLNLNGIETVPAVVARPRSVGGRVPGVLFNH